MKKIKIIVRRKHLMDAPAVEAMLRIAFLELFKKSDFRWTSSARLRREYGNGVAIFTRDGDATRAKAWLELETKREQISVRLSYSAAVNFVHARSLCRFAGSAVLFPCS